LYAKKLDSNLLFKHFALVANIMPTPSFITAIKDFLNAIRLWFDSGTVLDGKRYINRFKFLHVNAFVFLFVFSFSNYLFELIISYIITATAAACLIPIDYFIVRGRLTTARILMAIILNAAVLAINYAEGTVTGTYLYFFVLLIAFVFTARPSEMKSMIFVYIITLLCVIATFLVAPRHSKLQPAPIELTLIHFYINLFTSFLIGCLISFSMMRDSHVKEKALVEAKDKAEQAAITKSRFISNISHELRTPLNGIIGTTHLLLQENYTVQQQPHFDVLKFSSEHMLNLINDVLDFSKLEVGKMSLDNSTVPLRSFINKIEMAFRSQFEKKGLNFFVALDPLIDKEFTTDFTRLNQVLNNLLSNALKFTNEGGVKLCVKLAAMHHYPQLLVQFSVLDTGIGIAPDKTNLVFESFTQADVNTTRKYGGTGLGLSISHKLVQLLGGSLQLESDEHAGSRFYFTLPMVVVNQHLQHDTEQPTPQQLSPLTGIKVLVAEDNRVNMMIALKFLEKWGVLATPAYNGKEALAFYHHQTFDLLLIDLEMPEVDGFGVASTIRQHNTHIPIIAFTAAVFGDMKEKLSNHGFNGFLQKPFKPEDLHRIVLENRYNNPNISAA
jgi:signal transduction histidine kinase